MARVLWARFVLVFVAIATSAAVVAIVAKTAWVDYKGECLLDAEVIAVSTCDLQCTAAGDACAGGKGTCLAPQQCSAPCHTASPGTKPKCVFVVAGAAASSLVSTLLLIGLLLHINVGFAPSRSLIPAAALATSFFLLFAVMAAVGALQIEGRLGICSSIHDTGANCGDDLIGPDGTNLFPSHYNELLIAALTAGWVATSCWLILTAAALWNLCTSKSLTPTRWPPTSHAATTHAPCATPLPIGSQIALISGPPAEPSPKQLGGAWEEEESAPTVHHGSAIDLGGPWSEEEPPAPLTPFFLADTLTQSAGATTSYPTLAPIGGGAGVSTAGAGLSTSGAAGAAAQTSSVGLVSNSLSQRHNDLNRQAPAKHSHSAPLSSPSASDSVDPLSHREASNLSQRLFATAHSSLPLGTQESGWMRERGRDGEEGRPQRTRMLRLSREFPVTTL